MSAVFVTFNGVNESGYTRCFGITFPCGETVEVADPDLVASLRTHPEFTVSDEAPKAKAETAPKPRRAVRRPASRKVK